MSGITPAWFEHATGEVTIPMHGLADSLNVAVSASILMYGISERRDRSKLERAQGRDTREVRHHGDT